MYVIKHSSGDFYIGSIVSGPCFGKHASAFPDLTSALSKLGTFPEAVRTKCVVALQMT